MNTKTLSSRALSVIDQYLHFRMGAAVCSVPYFNNKTARNRAALRAYGGKGSPRDIHDEVEALAVKAHIQTDVLADESLKRMLMDNNLGIDCSGFAYYVLNAESEERGTGALDKHISFVNCHGLIGKMRCSLRPAENCDVATLADDKNSRIISADEIEPGDFISMTAGPEGPSSVTASEGKSERDHILVIHQVEYQNFVPTAVHYSHAAAYPEDGVGNTGIKQGMIEIADISKPLTESRWVEGGKEGDDNRIFIRARKSKTELRRLNNF